MAKDGNRQKFAGVTGGNLTPPQGGSADPAGDGAEGNESNDPDPSQAATAPTQSRSQQVRPTPTTR